MKRIQSWIVAFVVAGALLASSPAVADYLVGLSHGTNKHRPEFDFATDAAYRIYAAQNEWEPFLVLMRDDDGLANVNVTVTEFIGPGDPITGVELYRVYYQTVDGDRISHDPPDPARAGDWPDGLVPFTDHFLSEDRDGAPFDVPVDYSQAVFVDVFVPAGQTPGDYEATVTVTANNRPDWNGTVTLTVWDFVLPNGLSIASNYQLSRDGVCNWHAGHGGVTPCEDLLARYYQEYARHRMSPYGWRAFYPGYTWNDGTSTFDWDWTAFDAYHGPYLDGTFYLTGYEFTGIRLPGSPGGRPAYVPAEDWEREWWAGWADHFKTKGWIQKLWYYLPDEPKPSQYAGHAALAARIHNADPDLRPLVTEQFESELAGDIDIWCPDEPLFSDSMPWPPYPEVYTERQAMGETVWWYNCVSATVGFDYASHMVDQESTYMRVWLWMTRRYGFEGILFWHTNALTRNGQDVWDTMWYDRFGCQGDGTLFYPGTVDRIGGTTDIPIASLRLKYLREGMEDYEYFHLLDGSGDAAWVSDVTRTVAPKTFQWEHDWQIVLDWRRKVAEKIMGTLDETPPDPPTALVAEPQVEAVMLSWTAPADADLDGYDIWYGLYDGDALFGGRADAGATQAQLSGLTPGRLHRIYIRAFDENGNRSAQSEQVTAVPLSEGDDDDDESPDTPEDHDRNNVGVSSPDENETTFGCGQGR